ncbi:MAG: acyl-CoA dehydrogenase family protein, partial [Candidatus Aminicenantes bacterium]|nr:acyl-CoA dehydrogenase family protein [Candidatus Aminicenantes bacterium]
MDFSLNEEQLELKELTHQFAVKEIRPVAAEYDEKNEFPIEVMKKASEIGFLTSGIPVEYGGTGFSNLDNAITCEELAWGCAGMYTSIMANTLAITPIALYGTDEQKKEFLTPLTKEMKFACFALTEREAGSDNTAIKTTAVKDGDNYILNGSKTFITNAGVSSLGVFFASTDKTRGARGLTAFIIPMDLPGISVGKHENKMGHRASNTAEIYLDDVKVPAKNVLKREGFGFIIALKTLDYARPAVGAGGIGVARAAYEEALKYAQERIQFGKPIAHFQHNAFKLADMATAIEAARLIVLKAAWLKDHEKPYATQSAMAKLYAAETAMWVTTEAVQIHGGYG